MATAAWRLAAAMRLALGLAWGAPGSARADTAEVVQVVEVTEATGEPIPCIDVRSLCLDADAMRARIIEQVERVTADPIPCVENGRCRDLTGLGTAIVERVAAKIAHEMQKPVIRDLR